MIIVYFTLPENSVIAFGNKSENYRSYKKNFASERPVKPERTRSDTASPSTTPCQEPQIIHQL